ncbi:MAG: hypothetical protein JF887_07890 [Candidatus Dormibacteraeota bacterium]|uniref:Uncharacterized protein n=1 Tax=Candidatus Amunia macphersoniae TaxID=3127014 RepID=A0A934NJF5_9BACT|nr:hypothetical protein [Candidatus Dormibacteraeota bacterium]
MSLSVVLRLNAVALGEGRLAGEVFVVGVDRWSVVQSTDELLIVLHDSSAHITGSVGQDVGSAAVPADCGEGQPDTK